MQQIDLYGVFLPTLLVAALVAYAAFLALRNGLARIASPVG